MKLKIIDKWNTYVSVCGCEWLFRIKFINENGRQLFILPGCEKAFLSGIAFSFHTQFGSPSSSPLLLPSSSESFRHNSRVHVWKEKYLNIFNLFKTKYEYDSIYNAQVISDDTGTYQTTPELVSDDTGTRIRWSRNLYQTTPELISDDTGTDIWRQWNWYLTTPELISYNNGTPLLLFTISC